MKASPQTGGPSRSSALVAASLVAAVVAGLALTALLVAVTPENARGSDIAFSMGVAFFTLVGAVIVWLQPPNRIGWLFSAIGIVWVGGDLAGRYSTYAYLTGDGNGSLSVLGAWISEWNWFLFLLLTFSLLPQLFPTGKPLRGHWSSFLRATFVFTLGITALSMLENELVLVGVEASLDNPIGIPGFKDIEEGAIAFLLLPGGLIAILGGVASIIARFRRSSGDERLQLKWFTVSVLLLVAQFVVQSFFGGDEGHLYPVVDAVALALVPVSAAIAIFKYRLYDIDVVINRALVYAVLSAILAGAYLGIVVLLQGLFAPFTADSDVAVAGSTLAVATLFGPVRSRVQAFIDRRFYRHKYDAAETLEEFTASLRDEVDLTSLSRELVDVVASTMQPAHASLWLRTEMPLEGRTA